MTRLLSSTLLLSGVLLFSASLVIAQPYEFSPNDGTLIVEMTEVSASAGCTGDTEWAEAGVTCPGAGLEAWSAMTLNRCCSQSCSAAASGTMTVTAYCDPDLGTPLAPEDGGVPAFVFPAETNLELPLAIAEAVVGSSTNGSCFARLTIGQETIEVSSNAGQGSRSATIESIALTDGASIEISAEGSHSETRSKIGYARLFCGSATGPPSGIVEGEVKATDFTLITQTPIDTTVPIADSTWGTIKSLYRAD